MQLIVFLSLLLGAALATVNVNHANVTVYTVAQVRDDVRYGPVHLQSPYHPFLNELKVRPFVFVYPLGGKLSAVYVPNGFQGLGKYPEYVQSLNQGNKFLVLAYPWQLPRNVVDNISGLELIASAGHGQVGVSQLAQLAAEIATQPILLVQSRNENQVVRDEQLKEVGTVQVTHEGNVQVVRDVVVEHLQDPKYGAFFNPYGFVFQGHNSGYPFNYGYGFPYSGFQTQGGYPSFTYQGQYPYNAFPGQYPYSTFQGQYPFYGYQGQYPTYGNQGQYPNYGNQGQYPTYGNQGQYPNYGNQEQYNSYGPTVKHSPTFPGYTHNFGYNGVFPGYAPYLYPSIFGNLVYPFGYNYVPSPYYPGLNPFVLYGQKTAHEETPKAYPGYQYGSYPPYAFYAQQPQYQYGYQNQYQGYPFNYYQSYPFSQSGAKSYQYTPYQYQEYQYQPYQFQQYQPYHFPQYQPFQYQYYQNYQPYGQYYPQ